MGSHMHRLAQEVRYGEVYLAGKAGSAGRGGIRQHFIFLAFTLRPGFHTQFLSGGLFALRAIWIFLN